jgi:hypothetical protein
MISCATRGEGTSGRVSPFFRATSFILVFPGTAFVANLATPALAGAWERFLPGRP